MSMDLTNQNEIELLLRRHKFRFSRDMGQNFLIDPTVPELIADAAELDKTFGVLEVGPGIGCLTAELSKRAGRVVSVELDKKLLPILEETLAECENVRVVCGDALKMKLPELVKTELPGLRPAVCANLPYNVTTPLVGAFLESGCFESITVMVQREAAKRLCAGVGERDYGWFSFLVRWRAETEILFDVSPECFMPAPHVTSSVLRLTPRKTPLCPVRDEGLMLRVARAAFLQRRKSLVNAVSNGLGGAFTRERVAEALSNCGFDANIRGEALKIHEFCALADNLSVI